MKADLFKKLESWIFPFASVLTGKPTEIMDFEMADLQHFTQLNEVCPVCAQPSPKHQVCGQCLTRPPAFDQSWIAFPFKPPIRQMILDYKFHEHFYQSRLLAELWWHKMQERQADFRSIEALLPVPLHPNRLRQRGFNQSLELAKVLSKLSGIPLLATTLERVVDTPHQVGQDRRQRQKNLKQAFALRDDKLLSMRRVAIVDDVVTTGATMQAVAETIKQYTSVEVVEVWAIAKTVSDSMP